MNQKDWKNLDQQFSEGDDADDDDDADDADDDNDEEEEEEEDFGRQGYIKTEWNERRVHRSFGGEVCLGIGTPL